MTAIDWLGLWAALQVIGIILGIVVAVVLVIGGIVYVVGGTFLDERRRKRRSKP